MIGDPVLKNFIENLHIRDVRLMCQARDKLSPAIRRDQRVIFDVIRRDYIRRVGLKKYLLESLGSTIAWQPVSSVAIYDAYGQVINGNGHINSQQAVVEFLLQFNAVNLPHKIKTVGVKGDEVTLSF